MGGGRTKVRPPLHVRSVLRLGERPGGAGRPHLAEGDPVRLRTTTPEESSALADVHRAAFGRDEEADLALALMRDESFVPDCSLAAEDDTGRFLGHVLLSRAWLEDDDGSRQPLLCLAPLAVVPDAQRSGIGTALVREAIERAQSDGELAMIVLGHPSYYPRFGFTEALPLGICAPYDVPTEAWMVLELTPQALDGAQGTVKVPTPLDDPEMWRE